ncbi:phosphate/phosphite/phosphonate ABC transporter substrate-binding protein [Imhoffiella purpurea]|uniref:Phosphate-binding protein n=1 Tax=Imhoffiella purpurea TaxID=1249627 RepID=W9UZF1_9GAMM|nr:phosphate/phosphite/phosphonate ABC transporter substrate-binding protein [Imhoffiella purpurea]EXJ12618.1 phosphate-binding protein [Imhoffiella purpurea]
MRPILPIALVLCCAVWSVAACAEASFRLGVINERPDRPSDALKQYGPLNDYLSRRLAERDILVGDLFIGQDLDEMAAAIERGEVDALAEGVMPTLSIRRRSGTILPTLLLWRKGQRQYHAVFFARRDSAIQGLQDLRGRRIVFESPRSTSAYFLPLASMRAQGLHLTPSGAPSSDPARVRYLFAGSELNQAYWVQAGRADAGAFNNGDWERIPASVRQELRIFGRTRSVLRWLLSFSTGLDVRIREAVIRVFLDMPEEAEGRVALEAAARIARIERLTDADRADLDYWSDVLGRLDRPDDAD